MKRYIALTNLAIKGDFIKEGEIFELEDVIAKIYLAKRLIKLAVK